MGHMRLNLWQNTARPWHNGTNSISSNLNTLRHRPCVTNTRLKNITINVAPNTHSTLHIIQPGSNMSNSWVTTTDRENEKTNYRTNQTDNTNNRFTKKTRSSKASDVRIGPSATCVIDWPTKLMNSWTQMSS